MLQVTAIEIAILALASFRLAHMLTLEDGPFDVFALIRGSLDPLQRTWIGRGINCPLCVGFWASLFVLAVWFIPIVGPLLITWWAIAGLQTIIQKALP